MACGQGFAGPGVPARGGVLPGCGRACARKSSLYESFCPGERGYLAQACVIYHSIKAIGKDADGWFRYFSDISSPFAADLLFNMMSRAPENKSLAAFLWESEVTDRGLVYKQ